jgi:hypothetical protein
MAASREATQEEGVGAEETDGAAVESAADLSPVGAGSGGLDVFGMWIFNLF